MVQELYKGATVETQNQNIESAMGVYFDIVQEHSISLQSQITDNWMENNVVINDHVANQPLIVSLRGLSGELIYEPSENGGAQAWINDFAKNKLGASNINKLGALASLYPPVDNVTQVAKNAISYVEASVKRYKKVIDTFRSSGRKQERLRKIYQDLSALRENKTPLFVQTPYGSFDNMFIQGLILRQANQNYITDIELTLKQVNFVDSLTAGGANEENRANCNFLQRDTVENHGLTQGIGKDLGGLGPDSSGFGNFFKVSISYDQGI